MKTTWMMFVGGLGFGIGLGALLWAEHAPVEPDAPTTATAADTPAPQDGAPTLEAREPAGPDDLIVRKDAFLASYRVGFEELTGEAPSSEREEAAWGLHVQGSEHAPRSAGNRAARLVLNDRRKAEVTARDDIMTLLQDDEREGDVRRLRNDPEAFLSLLAHKTEGPTLDGAALAAAPEPIQDGAVLAFPAGIFTVTEKTLLGGRRTGARMPRDLTIRGAGMDETLIRLSDISVRDHVYNLHIADCTIDCDNDGAFDLRSEKASILLENVRFVRFDAGHGGCYVLDLHGGAVYCRGCHFAGGYGRSPGSGDVIRSVEVARFENCVFERIDYQPNSHEHTWYEGCTFRDCHWSENLIRASLASTHARGPRLANCTSERTIPGKERPRRDELRRHLRSLFPEFKDR